jgi:predicted tellurium resistance membrane protein TerC
VLAVAGAAQHHEVALIFGLGLSVVLMGVAASLVAGILTRYRWIAWLGLAVILYVAIKMIYEGADAALFSHGLPEIPFIKGPSAGMSAH